MPGSGATASLATPPTKIFQIWIEPSVSGVEPSWGAKLFPKSDRSGRFVPLASGFASDGEALPIRAEARVLGVSLKAGDTAEYELGAERLAGARQRRGQWRARRHA